MKRIKSIEGYLMESNGLATNFRDALDVVLENMSKSGVHLKLRGSSVSRLDTPKDSTSVLIESDDLSMIEIMDEFSIIYGDNRKAKIRKSGNIEIQISPYMVALIKPQGRNVAINLYKKGKGGISLYGLEDHHTSRNSDGIKAIFWNKDKFIEAEFEYIDTDSSQRMSYDESFMRIYGSYKSSDSKKYSMQAAFSGDLDSGEFEDIEDIEEE